LPEYFDAAVAGVTEEDVAEKVPHGPDAEPVLEEIRSYAETGFTHAYVHQIGPDQEGFLEFARRELLPHV
jgi:coenzyme F420-dependent glucose-6-phosphate dehydrogenase